MNVHDTLMRMTPAGRAEFISRAQQFISNPDFLNTLNRIDINRKETIGPTCVLLRAFDAVPGLRAQLFAWLRSAT